MLDHGRIIDAGEPKDVVDFYQNMMLKKMHQGCNEVNIKRGKNDLSKNTKNNCRSGISTNQVEILSVNVFDKFDHEINYFETDGFVKVVSKILSFTTLNDPHYGFIIRDKYGLDVYGASTESLNITTTPQHKGEIITAICSLNLPLSPGDYSICIGVANGACDFGIFEEYCLFIQDVAMIKIIQNSKKTRFGGLVNLNAEMDILKEINKQNTE
jgi:lipopolysaccharide transport system ATP-binding protein